MTGEEEEPDARSVSPKLRPWLHPGLPGLGLGVSVYQCVDSGGGAACAMGCRVSSQQPKGTLGELFS